MNQNKLDIEIRPEAAMGHYSNFAIITHSTSEFILDFVQHMPGLPKAQVNSRIIMTPENAKRLLSALADNLQKYESQFGQIALHEAEMPIIPPVGSNPAEA
ncbi:MAG: DUF3467 domain-containing protein [Bacteroidales bacterium]|nr:DUF3467 domain-containing protein [Candidatus Cacconaster merdequi]